MGDHRPESLPTFNENVCVVLINPQIDGNIGAVARSMLNFGFTDLRIVGRSNHWSDEARNRAKNAQTVLDNARCVESFQDAISDCSIVVGTSGKREDGDKTTMRHFLLPDELPSRLSETEGRVALVFGPEGKGLLNEELSMCDLLVTIPTWEGYPILNLSHAVTVICYSWYISSDRSIPFGAGERLLEPELRIRLRQEISRLTKNMPAKEHRRKGIEETLVRVILRGVPYDSVTQAAPSILSRR